MTAEQIQAISAVAALVVAAAALVVALASRRDQRTQLLTDIRQRWEELGADWATVLLLWDGGRTYYSDAPEDERRRVAGLVDRNSSTDEYINDPLFTLRAETAHLRRIARFFAYSADAVLRSKLSVNDVYAVFGPDVARHHQAALWIAGRELIREGRPTFYDVRSTYPAWASLADQITERHYEDEQAAIALLVWLCAGVQSRRGDTYVHLLLSRARYFRESGEWQRVSRSTAALSWVRGRFPLRPLLVRWLRFAASVPRSRATAARTSPIFTVEDSPYARRSLRRQIRRSTSS